MASMGRPCSVTTVMRTALLLRPKSPQAADPQILLGELGLFIALAEGLQTFQLVHQRLGYVL